MDSSNREVSLEVPPYIRVYKDGTIERTAGTEVSPAGYDSGTDVLSKDVVIVPKTGVTARLYRPNKITQKLPLLVYFHGGAFCISSPADPLYHNCLNNLVAEAGVVSVSVDYRRAPEHPLPAAYEDSWDVLQWVGFASHSIGGDNRGHEEEWLKEYVDFERIFLAGDSAGANIAHHLVLRLQVMGSNSLAKNLKVLGIAMVHPYFWGKEPIGVEVEDPVRKAMVDKWWSFVCPSNKGSDDPLINPFVDEAPSLAGLGCSRVLVVVAEKDILRDRGKLYYKMLADSGWKGKAEFYESEREDHVFHIFNPGCENARSLFKRIASFINQGKLIV